MFKKSLLLTALYALVAISQASASVVVYTDLASFTAAAGNIRLRLLRVGHSTRASRQLQMLDLYLHKNTGPTES